MLRRFLLIALLWLSSAPAFAQFNGCGRGVCPNSLVGRGVGAPGSAGFSAPGLPIWSAAVRAMQAGTADAILMAGPGDSTTVGAFSNATPALYRSNGWPPQLAASLTANKGLPAKWDNLFSNGMYSTITGSNTIGFWDSRVVNTANFLITDVGGGYTLGGRPYVAGSSATLRYTTNGTAIDTCDIYFMSASNVAATFQVNVGGSSLGTFGGIDTNGFNKLTVTFTRAIYTAVNVTGASGTYVLPIGFDCRDSTQKTIRIQNVSFGGAFSSDWTVTTNPWNTLAAVVTLHPHLCVISLGINDWLGAVLVATYQTNLTTIVSALQAAGIDVLLVTPFPSSTSAGGISVATQDTFVAAMKAVGTAKSAPVVDFYTNVGGTWVAANASGLASADGFHPNFAGYTRMQTLIQAAIAP